MKNILLLLLILIMVTGSCSIEKRHYRHGWYLEKENHVINSGSVEPYHSPVTQSAVRNQENPPEIEKKILPGKDSLSVPKKDQHTLIQKISKEKTPPRPHHEVLEEMKKNGCKPDPGVNALYIMDLICLITFFWIGPFLAVVTLILSYFVEKRLIKNNVPCLEENLEILHHVRRDMWIFLSIILGLAIIFSIYLFYLMTHEMI